MILKTILVAGGAGFLGSNLCRLLLDKGNKVICLDNFLTGNRENVADLIENERFKIVEHDICDELHIDDKIDQIYNLACPASPPHYQKNPIYTFRISTIGSFNLLELAKKNNATILLASTSEVYGDPHQHPQAETYRGNVNPIGPRACYDEGKRGAETLFFDYNRMYNTDIKVIRIFNTYGPYMDKDDGRVVSNFIKQALTNEDITIYGEGQQTRSFCYVDDLIKGIYLMMNSNVRGPINLGNSGEFTIRELAEMVIRITNSDSNIVYKDLPIDDPQKRRPNNDLAKLKLDWSPEIVLEDGLKKTISYFKSVL